MKSNSETLALIESFEGFEPRWYRDPVGIWTIGFGHTDAAGHPRYRDDPKLTITKADGRIILARDLVKYEADVTRLVRVPLNENQFGALVSFTYNLGAGNLGSSTLLRKLNAGDYAGAANEFPRWNKAGGKTLNGLVRRRAAEQALFGKRVTTPASSPSQQAPSGGILAAITAFLNLIFGNRK